MSAVDLRFVSIFEILAVFNDFFPDITDHQFGVVCE